MNEYGERMVEEAKHILSMDENNRLSALCLILENYDSLVKSNLPNVKWDKNKPFWSFCGAIIHD